MGKISLRAYNRDIDGLIDRGQTEEAIAHAKYILKQFPKHIDTYRLIGKAFLESQRYTEASDILQRVLSVIPDDFFSHLGMSIIREDEGNLDAAIWHMERAFEVQPSNSAVQEELRKLYGRRDGAEPPRLRLTRGALVRMYQRGELYAQSIAEARAALAEDPKRTDLEIILARLYYLQGKKVQATEICGKLVSKLPYCYEANRILAEILPTTTKKEDAKIYQQRVFALDPYAALVSQSTPTSDLVPNNAIMLEKLDWQPSQEISSKPGWAQTVGVEIEEPEETLPDWMDAIPTNAPITNNITLDENPVSYQEQVVEESSPSTAESVNLFEQVQDEEAIESNTLPDFLKEAGWIESEGSIEEQSPDMIENIEPSGDLAPAEIPDWLKSMAPMDMEEKNAEEKFQERDSLLEEILPPENVIYTEDRSSSLGGAVFQEKEENLDWLQEAEPAADANLNADLEDNETPDWLKEIVSDIPKETSTFQIDTSQGSDDKETSEWLESIIAAENSSGPSSEPLETKPQDWIPASETANNNETDLDDWLQTLGNEEQKVSTLPDELAGLLELSDPESPVAEETGPTEPVQILSTESIAEKMPETELPEEIDSSLDWLEDLADNQDLKEVQPLLTTTDQKESIPSDWGQDEIEKGQPEQMEDLKTAEQTEFNEELQQQLQESKMTSLEPETSEQTPDPIISILESQSDTQAPDEIDLEDAFAWLESLAVKQGADEETLILKPEDRQQEMPDWILKEAAVSDTRETQTDISESEHLLLTEDKFEALQNQLSTEKIDKSAEAESELSGESTLPDWLMGIEDEENLPVIVSEAEPEIQDWIAENISFEHIDEDTHENEISRSESSDNELQTQPTLTEVQKTDSEEEIVAIAFETETEIADVKSESLLDEIPTAQPVIMDQMATPEMEMLDSEKTDEFIENLSLGIAPPENETGHDSIPDWLLDFDASIESPQQQPEFDSDLQQPEMISEGEIVPADSLKTQTAPAETPDLLETLEKARADISSGDVENAITKYQDIVAKGELLENVISDLEEALYRYPVDTDLWQLLGDAFLKDNQLQKAIDSYTKAEELLR